MNNLIIDEITKKNLSTWKRIFIYFFDSLLVIASFLILFYTVGTKVIENTARDAIEGINEIYYQECSKSSLICTKEIYGLYQLDKDKYIENRVDNDGLSFDEAMEDYNNKYYEIDSSIQNYSNYDKYYQSFNLSYYVTLLVTAFISSFIFILLIPLTNKNNKTIGMFITKTSLVEDSTNIVSTNMIVFIRFFTIYAIEFALGYALIQLVGIILLFMINIIIISITSKKKTIHDLLSKCHIEKDEYTYTE